MLPENRELRTEDPPSNVSPELGEAFAKAHEFVNKGKASIGMLAFALVGSVMRVIDEINTMNVARNRRILAIEATVRELETRPAALLAPQTNSKSHAEARLQSIEAQLKELAARPELRYQGVWHSKAYDAGALVTKDGGLWFAEEPTSMPPGRSDSGWRLIAKGTGLR